MTKKDITKEYKTNELTIFWKPNICIHAAICVQSLPNVYRPKESPWINAENASTEELMEQINGCPSGALSFTLNNDSKIINTKKETEIMENSKVAGKTPIMVDLEKGKNYAWCACGRSANQPWCDGSHKGTGITPTVFKVEENKKAAMCMCKQTGNAPFCDGSHAKIK